MTDDDGTIVVDRPDEHPLTLDRETSLRIRVLAERRHMRPLEWLMAAIHTEEVILDESIPIDEASVRDVVEKHEAEDNS